MLNKVFDIDLNTLHQGHNRTDILVNQGDTRSVIFNFRIYEGAAELNYDDVYHAIVFFTKPDRRVIQARAERLPIGFTVMLNQDVLATPGVVTAGLALYGSSMERITTLFFTYHVTRDPLGAGILDDSIEYDALGRAIALLQWAIQQQELGQRRRSWR